MIFPNPQAQHITKRTNQLLGWPSSVGADMESYLRRQPLAGRLRPRLGFVVRFLINTFERLGIIKDENRNIHAYRNLEAYHITFLRVVFLRRNMKAKFTTAEDDKKYFLIKVSTSQQSRKARLYKLVTFAT